MNGTSFAIQRVVTGELYISYVSFDGLLDELFFSHFPGLLFQNVCCGRATEDQRTTESVLWRRSP